MKRAWLVLLLLATPGEVAAQEPVAIVNVRVVDVEAGEAVPGRTVLVEAGRIAAVGAADSVEIPEAARIVEGLGGWLLPGLTDLHAHPTDEWEYPLFLAHGVTTVQYLNASGDQVAARDRIARGEMIGPTLFVCAGPISGFEDPAEAAEAVARHDSLGFDCLKPYGGISEPALAALAESATARGMWTVSHIPRNLTWRQALVAGVDAIAHAEEFLYSPIESAADLETIDSLMVARGIALIPTLTNYDRITRQVVHADRLWEEGLLRYYSPVDRRFWMPQRNHYARDFTVDRVPRMRALMGFQRRLTRRLADAGVTILAGTDAGNAIVVPGVSLHDELEELVKAGLTPAEALRAATVDAAVFLGDDAGAIEPGRRADFVLVLGNPLTDVANARLVHGVMLRGWWLAQEDLNRLLDEAGARLAPEERLLEILESDGLDAALAWAAEADAADPDVQLLRPRALNELGYQLWKIEDRFAGALAVFQSNLRMHPDWWAAHGSLAEAYEVAGRTEEALAAYRQAVVRNPGWREGRERIRVLTDER